MTEYSYHRPKRETNNGGTAVKILSVVFAGVGTLIVVGTILFKAGSYPSKEEIDKIQERTESRLDNLQRSTYQLEKDQIEIRSAVKNIDASQQVLHNKLDRALLKQR